jgi:hypothetical protein
MELRLRDLYRLQKQAGLCVDHGCKEPPVPGSVRCKRHKELRKRKKPKGDFQDRKTKNDSATTHLSQADLDAFIAKQMETLTETGKSARV